MKVGRRGGALLVGGLVAAVIALSWMARSAVTVGDDARATGTADGVTAAVGRASSGSSDAGGGRRGADLSDPAAAAPDRPGERRVRDPRAPGSAAQAAGANPPESPQGATANRVLAPVVPGPVTPTIEVDRSPWRSAVGSRSVAAEGPLRVEVRIFADEDDEPLSDVAVTVYRQPDPFVPATVLADGRTGAHGRIVFAHPGPGRIVVRVGGVAREPITDDHIAVPDDRSLVIEGRLRSGVPVEGVVTRDEDGAPVTEGVVTVLWRHDIARLRPYQEVEIAARCPIGSDGRFRFDAARIDGRLEFHVAAPGRATLTDGRRQVDDSEMFEAPVSLSVGAVARGTVRSPDGSPAANATVVFVRVFNADYDVVPGRELDRDVIEAVYFDRAEDEVETVHTWTDERGRYEATGLGDGADYVVIALSARAGCSRVVGRLHAHAGAALAVPPLTLREFGRVELTLVGEDGERVVGAKIRPIACRRLSFTDRGDGRFDLARADPIAVRGRVEAPHGRSATFDADVHPGRTIAVRVVLAEGLGVGGRVVDTNGGPVAGARVWLHLNGWVGDDFQAHVETDADGRFEARGLSAGTYGAWIERDGHVRLEVDDILVPGPSREFVLRGAAALTVALRAEGRALRDGEVESYYVREFADSGRSTWWHHDWLTTDTDGRVTVTGLPTGRQRIAIEAAPYRAVVVEVDLEPGETRDLGEVELQPRLVFRGRVVDEHGLPVEGAEIRLVGDLLAPFSNGVTTDAEGRFRGEFAEPGSASAWITADGFVQTSLPINVDDDAAETTLVLPRGVVVQGIARDASGAPIAEREIAIRPILHEKASYLERNGGLTRFTTDADGRFSARLLPGAYEFPTKGWFDETRVVDVAQGALLVLDAPFVPEEQGE